MILAASKLLTTFKTPLIAIGKSQTVTLEASGGVAEISFDGSGDLTALLVPGEPVAVSMPWAATLFARKVKGKPVIEMLDVTGADKADHVTLLEPDKSTPFKRLSSGGDVLRAGTVVSRLDDL